MRVKRQRESWILSTRYSDVGGLVIGWSLGVGGLVIGWSLGVGGLVSGWSLGVVGGCTYTLITDHRKHEN
jgi:hypothetical protein